jgi:hypothetical protein
MGMLAEHPQVLARLRKEILGRVDPTQMPTYDDLREMKYLRAVINGTFSLFFTGRRLISVAETLRLYTPVLVQ